MGGSKSKDHVDRKRGAHGNAIQKQRTEMMIRDNKKAQVRHYQIESPEFEVYKPKPKKSRKK